MKKYNNLLTTNDILRLLKQHLNLTPHQKGRSIFFLCPFHADKSPSLSLEPTRKIFTCFSCGFKAGNIFNFWSQYKKISEKEAQKEISKLGYFSLSEWQENEKIEKKSQDKISEFLCLVKNIYQYNLSTPKGQEVLDYLQNKRQLNKELINDFSLGTTIDNKQITNLLFQNTDLFQKHLILTNLIQITDNNQVYDYFRERQLIFPLKNEEGEVVAFATRKMEIASGESKYNYLPTYQHYHKSSLLYNYFLAKKSREEECYLVEGFFDVISLAKIGKKNCVALLGTNLSEEQIKLLQKLKKRIILFLDGDKAGKEATIHISIDLLAREIDCEVIKYDYQGDPDEICRQHRQHGKEIVQNILQDRQNPYSFILEYYFKKWEIKKNPQRISRFISEIAQIFHRFKGGILDFLVEKISLLINWKKEEVEAHFIHRQWPAQNIHQLQVIYCQERIGEKEKKIIYLCAKNRFFWLLFISKNYFFSCQNNRKNYQNIYNYYISSLTNEFKNYLLAEKDQEAFTITQKENIEVIFQEIKNIKKFIYNNEQN